MVSSASAQIEATGGNNLKTTITQNGVTTVVPDYAKVQGILIGVVAAFVVFITIIGPEYVPSALPYPLSRPSLRPLILYLWLGTYDRVRSLSLRNHGSHFEKHKTAFEEGGGDDNAILEEEDLEAKPGTTGVGVHEVGREGKERESTGSVRSENIAEKV